jgi:signal peptidase I
VVSLANEDDVPSPTAAKTLRELPLLLLAAAVIAFLVKTFIAQAFFIPSGSMLPQLQVDDRVVVSKLSYKLHDPHRGDIVVFDNPRPAPTVKKPSNPVSKVYRKVGEGIGLIQPSTEEFIKRVVALPGEEVDIKEGKVYINGRELVEPYLTPGTLTLPGILKYPQTVPPNSLFVMGDNRGNSSDSRVFGPISQEKVVGRTIVKVWPFGDMSFL